MHGRFNAFLLICASLITASLLKSLTSPASVRASFQRLRRPPVMKAERNAHPATTCGGTLNVGFQIRTFSGGLRGGIWYPSTGAETPYSYPGRFESSVALDGPIAACGPPYPLVVFSHGFGGCSIQTVFFMEALVRAGYIVAAPDHKDAMCKVDQALRINLLERANAPTKQHDYSDASYRDRDIDMETVLNHMLQDPRFSRSIDRNRIAGAGHSLGGYTILGMAGAWPSWKDPRIKAALLFSPFLTPYLANGGLSRVHIPVMYQGGTRDFGITPDLSKQSGAYDVSNVPKYFVEFKGVGHLDWSNWACGLRKYVPECTELEKPRLIDSYAIAFLDRYLKDIREPMLDRPNAELADLRHAD